MHVGCGLGVGWGWGVYKAGSSVLGGNRNFHVENCVKSISIPFEATFHERQFIPVFETKRDVLRCRPKEGYGLVQEEIEEIKEGEG